MNKGAGGGGGDIRGTRKSMNVKSFIKGIGFS
jgi:hypothetical protein